jgi:hypothetical protein
MTQTRQTVSTKTAYFQGEHRMRKDDVISFELPTRGQLSVQRPYSYER